MPNGCSKLLALPALVCLLGASSALPGAGAAANAKTREDWHAILDPKLAEQCQSDPLCDYRGHYGHAKPGFALVGKPYPPAAAVTDAMVRLISQSPPRQKTQEGGAKKKGPLWVVSADHPDARAHPGFLAELAGHNAVVLQSPYRPDLDVLPANATRAVGASRQQPDPVFNVVSVPDRRYLYRNATKHAYRAPLNLAPADAAAIRRRIEANEPDPKIEGALRFVTAASLRGTVEYLSSTYFTRQSYSKEARDAGAWIAAQLGSYGFEVTTVPFDDRYSANIIADLKGTETPERIVLVGAHYDCRSTDVQSPTMRAPGADDNGSGTANVLEIASAIHRSGLRFKYTIRLAAWSGEEQGLVGSRAYARWAAANNVDFICVFNGDMLGYQLPGYPVTLGMKDRYISETLLEAANGITRLYLPSLQIGTSSSCCSDHQSFTEQGYDAIGYFEHQGGASDYPHYHKSTDLPEHLNFDQAALFSQAILASTLTFAGPLEPGK